MLHQLFIHSVKQFLQIRGFLLFPGSIICFPLFSQCDPYISSVSLPVSYTHLDVYKRQVDNSPYGKDFSRRTHGADTVLKIRGQIQFQDILSLLLCLLKILNCYTVRQNPCTHKLTDQSIGCYLGNFHLFDIPSLSIVIGNIDKRLTRLYRCALLLGVLCAGIAGFCVFLCVLLCSLIFRLCIILFICLSIFFFCLFLCFLI